MKKGDVVTHLADGLQYKITEYHSTYHWIQAEPVTEGRTLYNKLPRDFEKVTA